jgi:hypothetical protein
MRLHCSFLLALLAAAPPAAAQTAAREGWYLGGGVDALRFGHINVVTDDSGLEVEVRPTASLAVHLALSRVAGPWNLSLEAGWAEGHVEAASDDFSIRDLTSSVTRYRLGVTLGRRLAALGSGALSVELAPTLDLWSVPDDHRTRAGAEGRVVVRAPIGALELENRLGFGFSGGPLEEADLGSATEKRGLRSVMIGVGVRAPL